LKKENDQSVAAFLTKLKRPLSQLDIQSIFEETYQNTELIGKNFKMFSLPPQNEIPEFVDPTIVKNENDEKEEEKPPQSTPTSFKTDPLFGKMEKNNGSDLSRLLAYSK